MKRNKTTKHLLMGMSAAMILSILPIENVFANENEIPNLNIYIKNNGSPKLEWATEMLQENILTSIDFETEKSRPLLYQQSAKNEYDKLHEISSIAGYQSNYGYLLNDNNNGKGNYFNFPSTSSNNHLTNYGTFYFENGIPLSLTFKAKSIGKSTISPWGNGGLGESFSYLNVKTTKAYIPGERVLHVDSLNGITVGMNLAFETDVNNIENVVKVMAIDTNTKTLTLNRSSTHGIALGENLKYRPWRGTFTFNSRTLNNQDWETYSINTFVNNYNDYNVAVRGAVFYLTTSTNGQLIIDDVTFGHATQVEVFRDNTSVYKGYLSDFEDTAMKDILKPNKVEQLNTSISNDFKVHFNPVKPTDVSKKVSYTIQSITQNGRKGEMSKPQVVETATGVTKYKYSITQSASTPTTYTNTTTGLDFDIPLSSLNLNTDYIHIKAVDGAGNLSNVKTFKVSDIVDMSTIQDLYDKLKSIEDYNDYGSFIEFLDEVESLYGTKMPQDVKDRIQALAAYHGENTTFLQLLEGEFTLQTSDITSFGKVKLTAAKQIIKTSFLNDFKVIDARGTQEGWKVNVSATPFIEDSFTGFIGVPTQLPIGTLAINTVQEIQQVGLVHQSKLPVASTNDFAIIDSGELTVLNANKGAGMGEFTFNFGDDALSMVVDSTTAKIDNKNYPEGITPYTSTITWNLITGP